MGRGIEGRLETKGRQNPMSGNPEVSIIIPAFNAGRFLRATLESVISQENAATEIVVVDDGSTDDTVAVARCFGNRVRLIEGSHRGAQAARNTGLAASRARFVKFLDADDVLLPGALTKQLAQAALFDERSIPYGPARTMDADGNIGGMLPHTPPRPGLHPIAHMLFYSPLTSCPLHRRSLLDEVCGMDESLPREHENDLHIRLCLAGVRFQYDPEPVYAYRRHEAHQGLMSGGFARFGADWMLNYLRRQEDRIRAHFQGIVPDDVSMHLAWFYWKSGRAVLREEHRKEAMQYFAEAARVSPSNHVCGKWPYRVVNSISGPIRSEKWLQMIRRL